MKLGRVLCHCEPRSGAAIQNVALEALDRHGPCGPRDDGRKDESTLHPRHCERSEAIQGGSRFSLDCHGDCVASQ